MSAARPSKGARAIVRQGDGAPLGGRIDAADAALVLPAEITFGKAAACRDMLVQGLDAYARRQPGALVADAAALSLFDTSALAVLLECRREAVARGRAFVVRNLHPGLAGLAALYGVAGLLQIGD